MHEQIGLSEVAVVFRDFVFQNQFAPKSIPGQIGNQAMVLVPVIAVVSQDDVRRKTLLERFEILLDFGALVGEKAVAKASR